MTDTLVSQRITLTSIRTKTADHGVKSMKRDVLASLEKRYKNLYTCPHYVIYTLLDARFKEVFFTDEVSAHEILEEAYTRYAQQLRASHHLRSVSDLIQLQNMGSGITLMPKVVLRSQTLQ